MKEGVGHERGLQPRRQDPRRRHSPAKYAAQPSAGWCSSTRPPEAADRAAARREGGRWSIAWPSAPTARPSRPDSTIGRDVGGVVLWDTAASETADRAATRRERGRGSWAWPSAPTARPSRRDSTASDDYGGGVVLFDTAARKRLSEEPLTVKRAGSVSVAFSPDGKTIAAGIRSSMTRGGSGGLRQRPPGAAAGGAARREGGHRFIGVAFSPDGKTLAADSSPATTRGGERGAVRHGRTGSG